MHIAFLTAEYPPTPGGVGDYTRCLGHALVSRGVRVTVVTGTGSKAQESPPDTALRVYRGIASWGWHCWRDTIAALDDLRPDVLHIQYQTGAYGMHPAVNLLPWRLRALAGRPHTVVTFHDLLHPYLFPKAGRVRHWVTTRLARDADAVIVTNADDAAQLAVQRLPCTTIPIGSNIAVAPPPDYQRAAWRTQLGVQPDDMLVAYFGLLSRSKGVDVLLDALAHMHEHHPDMPRCMLLMIGGAATAPHDRAYASEIQHHIARHGLQDRVITTGHVDEPTVSAHLLAADCVALPFRSGASLRSGSLLAALAHDVPVVTTSGPDSVGGLFEREGMVLVPPGDSTALAGALQQVAAGLRSHGARPTRAGASWNDSPFGWDAIARAHEQVYQGVR